MTTAAPPLRSPVRRAAAAFTLAAFAAAMAAPAIAQNRVDLTQWQTPIRDQENRTTCITFSAVAAVEARYKRLGQDLDLSEEFVNYLRKMFWLEPYFANNVTNSDVRENQLGFTGGGGGAGVLEWMSSGLAAPLEQYFTYRENGFSPPYSWNHSHWDSQRNVNSWNLDPNNLPRSALKAPRYYYPTGFQRLNSATNTGTIEAALQNGYEVVWDFWVAGNTNGSIWRASSTAANGSHSMLIVGYDRSSPNQNDWHFICKNSWGPTSNPGGFTHIAYNYIQYGISGAIVTGASPSGKVWPELQLLGRRNICFDGWRGTLDIYHIPGINQMHLNNLANGIIDRRVGTYYDSNGNAFRVNGFAYGKTLQFWFKGGAPNMRYDEQRETPTVGRNYVYTIVDTDGDEMAGRHHDNPGPTPTTSFGGYAIRPSSMGGSSGFLTPDVPGNANTPEQYIGTWNLRTNGKLMTVRFSHRDDTRLPLQQRFTWAALVGDVITANLTTMPIMMRVEKASPRHIDLVFPHPAYGTIDLEGWMLTWQRGVVAGLAEVGSSPYEAFYMQRLDDYTAGATSAFGTACGPVNSRPFHEVNGIPEIGMPVRFDVPNLAPNAPTMLAFGLSDQTSPNGTLPLSLTNFGMTGCSLYVDPLVTLFVLANSGGLARSEHYFSHASLRGAHVYSQYFVIAPGANALGLVTSNAVDTELGGRF